MYIYEKNVVYARFNGVSFFFFLLYEKYNQFFPLSLFPCSYEKHHLRHIVVFVRKTAEGINENERRRERCRRTRHIGITFGGPWCLASARHHHANGPLVRWTGSSLCRIGVSRRNRKRKSKIFLLYYRYNCRAV